MFFFQLMFKSYGLVKAWYENHLPKLFYSHSKRKIKTYLHSLSCSSYVITISLCKWHALLDLSWDRFRLFVKPFRVVPRCTLYRSMNYFYVLISLNIKNHLKNKYFWNLHYYWWGKWEKWFIKSIQLFWVVYNLVQCDIMQIDYRKWKTVQQLF